MNRFGITLGVASLMAAMSSVTFAQDEPTAGLKNFSLASLSDAPPSSDLGGSAGLAQATDQPSAAEASAASVADSGPKPWKLPQPCAFEKLGINMGGWVEQGITYDGWNPVDRFNGPILTNDRSGEYQLNQAWLYFVRPTKTDGCGFDIGGRVDVVYGEDWRFGQCGGLETRFDDPNSFYGLVLPQFYMEVAYNDLTVKMGHFATLTSLEVVPAPLNFFYSHSYLMSGYFDPVLVTGLQAEYKLNDNLTAVGGFNRGWQLFENPNETLNFLGGVKWASDDKKSSLSVMLSAGPTVTFAGFHDVDNLIMVYTHQFSDRFWSGSQVTVGRENDGSVINPGQDDTWYGFEQIFTYKLNEKWSAGVRYEWVQDNEGSRIAGIGNLLGTGRGWNGAPGFAGNFSDVTVGLNYRPNANWVLRPELRADFYNGRPNVQDQLPFNTFGSSYQLTAAVDAIVTF
jgi:hypothetical protein